MEWNASMVPLPPSDRGTALVWASGQLRQMPSAMTRQVSSDESVPLNESGAIEEAHGSPSFRGMVGHGRERDTFIHPLVYANPCT